MWFSEPAVAWGKPVIKLIQRARDMCHINLQRLSGGKDGNGSTAGGEGSHVREHLLEGTEVGQGDSGLGEEHREPLAVGAFG